MRIYELLTKIIKKVNKLESAIGGVLTAAG